MYQVEVCFPPFRIYNHFSMHNSNSFFKKYVKIIVVLAVIASSSSGIFVNLISAPPMAIGFWRLAMALPFFAIPVLTKQRETLKDLDSKDLITSILGGVFLFAHFFTWFSGVKIADIASAVTLGALHPLVVLFVSVVFYKKKVGVRAVMGIVLALLGGAMVAGFDYHQLVGSNFKGDMLAFLSAVFMGLYFLMGEKARERVPGTTYVFLVFLTTFICFAIGVAVTGTKVLGYPAADYGMLIALTLLCQIGAHAVFNLCIGYVDSLYVSTWETGETIFSIILGAIFLSQIPNQYQIVGCMVVVIGLLYYNYYWAKDNS